jgi:hypothetical protein
MTRIIVRPRFFTNRPLARARFRSSIALLKIALGCRLRCHVAPGWGKTAPETLTDHGRRVVAARTRASPDEYLGNMPSLFLRVSATLDT